jgi:hypothetical protein
MITMINANMDSSEIYQQCQIYFMKLPEDGPKYGPKLVAVIKSNQCKQLDRFTFQIFVVLMPRG